MPKEAFYFSHDSNARTDEKILKLRFKHGWKGYGIYWALVEMLRDASNYELELDYGLLAYEIRCDEDILNSIIHDFKLFEITETHFFSTSLKRRMELKDEKSEKAKQAANKRWAKRTQSESNANAMQTHSERNAIKERKKEKKEINTDEPNGTPRTNEDISFKVDFTVEAFKTDEANEAWTKWLQYNIQEHKPISRIRQEEIKKKLKQHATHNNQLYEKLIPPIIDKCISSGWKNIVITEEMEAKIKNHVREAND